jgi:hypothetical protein
LARRQTVPPVGRPCQLRTGRLATNSKMKQGRKGTGQGSGVQRPLGSSGHMQAAHTALRAIRALGIVCPPQSKRRRARHRCQPNLVTLCTRGALLRWAAAAIRTTSACAFPPRASAAALRGRCAPARRIVCRRLQASGYLSPCARGIAICPAVIPKYEQHHPATMSWARAPNGAGQ